MSTPRATARLQLNSSFTLMDACEQVSYYAALGVSHFYLSPVTQAVRGSTHGYDVTDPAIVNPELGGEAAFARLAQRLRAHQMGIILDIVPNHMAAHAANPWWWDVLRLGPRSAYADWFDIDWDPIEPALAGKVLAPFLAQNYEAALNGGTLSLAFEQGSQSFVIQADGARYPVAPESLSLDGRSVALTLARHDSATAEGRRRLHALLERQHYVLSWWRCAADRINWRRFFEVNSLIGVRVERQAVFDALHALPLRLFAEGLIDGVRIDHVDGLAHPLAYCRQLKAALKAAMAHRAPALRNGKPWMIVEKILTDDERLDERWAAHGTTGYDFMAYVGAVLHDPNGEPALTALWKEISGVNASARKWLIDARYLMLRRHFVAEYQSLLRTLWELVQLNAETRDWALPAIDRVMRRFLSVFFIYRTYLGEGQADARDIARLSAVAAQLHQQYAFGGNANDSMLLDVLIRCLSTPAAGAPAVKERHRMLRRTAINRFQQLTPALAAKSLEDTVFYRYGRLLSRNEVGSSPMDFALSAASFHQHNAWRAEHAPDSMVTTATHDQKRGEDARARLAIISEIPDQWIAVSRRWLNWPGFHGRADKSVHAAERYMLMQTIVGAWPLDLALDDSEGMEQFTERIAQWQIKALREAKTSSGWMEPNLSHERRCTDEVRRLLLGERTELLARIVRFINSVAPAGAVNSLAQLVLRLTVPGVPDLYQGTEFWDFTLVDPDNRRAVDFVARREALDAARSRTSLVQLLADWRNGHIKQAVIARILSLRCKIPQVFAHGQYLALSLAGPASAHALAFLRVGDDDAVLVVVPRLCSHGVGIGRDAGLPLIHPDFWSDSYAVLPNRVAARAWRSALTGEIVYSDAHGRLPLKVLLAQLPIAVLRAC